MTPPFNVFAYGPKSLSGVIMRARMLAVQGKTAVQIAEELDVHVMAAQHVVDAWNWHKVKFKKAAGQ